MMKTRLPNYYKDRKKLWNSINKKLSPWTISSLTKLTKPLDEFIKRARHQFPHSPEIVNLIQERNALAMWAPEYNENSAYEFISLFMKSFNLEQITSEIQQNPSRTLDLLQNIDQLKATHPLDEEYLKANAHLIMFKLYMAQIDWVALLSCGKQMYQLIKLAKEGDDKALFQIISLDKTLLTCEWITARVRLETIKGNTAFFKSLGEAVATPLDFKHANSHIMLTMFLCLLWGTGRHTLTDPELCAIINKLDFIATNPSHLRQFRNRLGLKRYTQNKVDLPQTVTETPPSLSQ